MARAKKNKSEVKTETVIEEELTLSPEMDEELSNGLGDDEDEEEGG